ncbi:hypothetical protein JW721_01850 [Candidatus Micrarchaeota archaeon]|nr:hypothetical protein [Candidatus Micrarchaeota archaeon]
MSKNGNNNGRGGDGAGGGQKRVSAPPTNINDARRIAELEQQVATLTSVLQSRNSSEGPMGCNSPLPSEYVSMASRMDGSCAQPAEIHPSLTDSADFSELEEKSRFQKALEKFHSAITGSPVRSTVSPVTWLITAPLRYWRGILRIAAGGAAVNGGASAYQQSPDLSLGNVGSAFMSNLRDVYNFAAEKIGSFASMDLLAGFGTVASYVCAGACVLSAAFNRGSLKKIANRFSTSALFLGLPNIVSDVSRFMDSSAPGTTEGAINCFGTGSSLAIIGFASIRLISYFLPDGIPLAGRIKNFVKNRRNAQAPAQLETREQAATAQAAQKAPGRIQAAVYGVAGAIASALAYIPAKVAGKFGKPQEKPSVYPSVMDCGRRISDAPKSRIGSYMSDALEAWMDGNAAPQATEEKIIEFMGKVSMSMNPNKWVPVFVGLLESAKNGTDAYEQASRILSNDKVVLAIDGVSASLSGTLEKAVSGQLPEGTIEKMNVSLMEEMYIVLDTYDQGLGGGILTNIGQIPGYIRTITEAQQGNTGQNI